jgi:stage II sporulation protein D
MEVTRSWRLTALTLFTLLAGTACDRMPFEPATREHGSSPGRDAAGSTAFTGNVRIGVVPSASNVSIGAAGAWELVEKLTGDVVMTGSGGTLAVTIVSATSTDSLYLLQVACYGAAALQTWLDNAAAAGYTTWTEFVPASNCTRARLVNTSGSNAFGARNAFRNDAIAAGLAGTDSFWVLLTTPGAAVLRVAGPSAVEVKQGAILRSANDRVTINGVPYRGVAEVALNSSRTLAGINELPIEQYLYGVVPRELGPIAYPYLEALKAQAVAARTFAIRGIGRRGNDGYDLLATTTDQVYGGLNAEHPLSTQAVDETAALVAKYNGALIESLYSSTSGGFTADNEEVFNSAPVAYLRGVPDANRGSAFEHVPSLAVFKNHANAQSLRGMSDADYGADWSRYHRWTIDWSAEEISQVISVFAQRPVGRVHEINVLERGPSGRVLRIEYVTDEGTFTDTKDRIRASLRFYNASGVLANLLSTLFYIEPVIDRRTGGVTGFVAYGGGWGHGVGMSQTGAVGMAERGATFDEILKHYYRDITLEPGY